MDDYSVYAMGIFAMVIENEDETFVLDLNNYFAELGNTVVTVKTLADETHDYTVEEVDQDSRRTILFVNDNYLEATTLMQVLASAIKYIDLNHKN